MKEKLCVILVFLFASADTEARVDNNFSSFTVDEVSENAIVKLNLSNHSIASQLKPDLSGLVGENANFADKYYLCMDGCGSICQLFIAIDIDTGKVVDVAQANLDGCFEEGSKLLIVNPKLTENFDEQVPNWAFTYYYKIGKLGLSFF
jgi:hypothetical protein